MTDMQTRWLRLNDAFGRNQPLSDPDLLYKVLIKRAYRDDSRYYHNLDHIRSGLDVLDQLGADRITKVAWWFHDVVYVPGATDNEKRSAEAADHWIQPSCFDKKGVSIRDEVYRLILLTKHHAPAPWDVRGQQITIADLHQLGAPNAIYDQNAANIRKEFGAFDDSEWRVGRMAFLNGMIRHLEAVPVPFNGSEWTEWTVTAIHNMWRERESL